MIKIDAAFLPLIKKGTLITRFPIGNDADVEEVFDCPDGKRCTKYKVTKVIGGNQAEMTFAFAGDIQGTATRTVTFGDLQNGYWWREE